MTKAIAIFDMPDKCYKCPIFHADWQDDECGLTYDSIFCDEERHPSCPLIEVDDHKAEIIMSKPEKPREIPIVFDGGDGNGKISVPWGYACGRCGEMVIKDRPYCPSCGAGVDWSESTKNSQ